MAPKPSAAEPRSGSLAAMMLDAAQGHQRAVEATQSWSESVLRTLKEQADSYGALLRSVDVSMRSMEQAIKSQAETTKAMAQSLEAAQQVVASAVAAQQQGLERVESFVGGVLDALAAQSAALRTQWEAGQEMLTDPLAAQNAVLKMTQDWMEGYRRLLGSANTASPRAGEE